MVREKISRSEKSQELHLELAKNLNLWKNPGNSEILRVHMYFCRLFLRCKILFTFYGHESCCIGRILFVKLNDKLMFGISRKSILFARYGLELSIHVHCKWLAEIKSLDLMFLKGHVGHFHVMSQQTWCSKTMKRRPCWCSKRILRKLFFVNAFFCCN